MQPDWNIGELYEKAFAIVKKNKVLWIFGAAVGGAASFSNSYNFNSNGLEKIFEQSPKEQTTDKVSQVLGAATASSPFTDSFGQIFSTIPPFVYGLLTLEIIAFIALTITVALITKAWLTGSLLQGTKLASGDKNVSIAESSRLAFPAIKSLIWIQVIPGLFFALISIPIFAILIIGIAAGNTSVKVLFSFLLFGAFIGLIIAGLFLTMAGIWGSRKITFEGVSGKQGFMSGFSVAKRKFWSTLLLGFVNNLLAFAITIGLIIGLVILLALFGFTGGALWKSAPALAAILIFLGVLVFIAFIVGATVIQGMITAFKASVWTLAYNSIKGKYDK